ncbi:sugar transferase [Erythrobacter sp.]|uniref:sugar transferase n=1 Tax=Erythrobacter sp. TaxID=1042 RepID=UPI0032EFB15F
MFPRWRRALAHRRFLRRRDLAQRLTSRALDCVIAIGLLVALAPLMLTIAAILILDGPVFEHRERVGRAGLVYREMRFRVTPGRFGETSFFGPFYSFMRQSNVHELPRLMNVLRADMSVVGPSHGAERAESIRPGLIPDAVLPNVPENQRPKTTVGSIWFIVRRYSTALAAVFTYVPPGE